LVSEGASANPALRTSSTVGSKKMNRLINIGFRKIGSWARSQDGIEFSLSKPADTRNILQSFVSEGIVLYVGKTTQTLGKRIYGYHNPGPTQSTNIKGNKRIKSLLADGKEVDIYALPDNGLLYFGAFHINLAAGLEDSIVKTLNPIWNKTGTAKK